MKLRLVSATRLSSTEFWEKSWLGRSLSLFRNELLPELAIQFDNRDRPEEGRRAEGLASFYQRALDMADDETNLLFVHDDVFVHDMFLKARLTEAFRRFDVVGLAGSRSKDLTEPSWALRFDRETLMPLGWQTHEQFAGAVSHHLTPLPDTRMPEPEIGIYGPLDAECTLLDGLFLAVRTRAVKAADVRFDPRFDFHHYDIDFCRQAKGAKLSLGTWPILVTHGSGGAFATEAWRASARTYLAKWNAREFEKALTKPLSFESLPHDTTQRL